MYQISEMRVWSILLKSIAQERSPETADVLQNDIPLFLSLSLPSSAIEPASVSDDPGHPMATDPTPLRLVLRAPGTACTGLRSFSSRQQLCSAIMT